MDRRASTRPRGAITNYQAFLTATGSQNFYYPDQSVDGNWVVFNENDDNSAANNDGDGFYNRQSVVEDHALPPAERRRSRSTLTNLNVGTGPDRTRGRAGAPR